MMPVSIVLISFGKNYGIDFVLRYLKFLSYASPHGIPFAKGVPTGWQIKYYKYIKNIINNYNINIIICNYYRVDYNFPNIFAIFSQFRTLVPYCLVK